jgi:hypothetical protein
LGHPDGHLRLFGAAGRGDELPAFDGVQVLEADASGQLGRITVFLEPSVAGRFG